MLSSRTATLRAIYAAMEPVRRRQLFLTLGLMVVSAIAEVFTIGAVIPLLALVASPDLLDAWPRVAALFRSIGPDGNAILGAAILLAIAAVASTLVRIGITWLTGQFVYGLQHDLMMRIYGRIIRQSYDRFIRQNSSVALSALEKVSAIITGSVLPGLLAIISGFIALCIAGFLLVLNPLGLLVAVGTIGTVYVVMTLASRRIVLQNAVQLAETRTARIQIVQESLGGFRDIVLDHSQPLFEDRLRPREDRLRRLLSFTNLLAYSPRFVVEGAAVVLVAVIAAWLSFTPGGLVGALPVLGALAVGAQRLLPLLQAVFQGWASYELHSTALADVADMLHIPVSDIAPRRTGAPVLPFFREIVFRQVGFAYVPERPALTNVDVAIPRGARVGLIGRSGSGKSTFVDLLMGLIRPTEGRITIDGRELDRDTIADWQAQIAHVPQAIFLADDTIAANVAFGSEDAGIDMARVRAACARASILNYIEDLPRGFDTQVGERGIRLSGGQRQRIGIARALYRRATVLILDEATSALDGRTEAEFIAGLDAADLQGLTVIMIAHRHSTLAACDVVYRLEDGKIAASGKIADLGLQDGRST